MSEHTSVGFALPDMIFLACFLGLLATVTVPAFRRYMERAKALDVLPRLKKIADGAAAYYEESDRIVRGRASSETIEAKKRFPSSTPVTPARRCCEYGREGLCEGTDWDTPTWRSLNFQLEGRHRFRYQFLSHGLGDKAMFTVRAHADMDCDGAESTFERVGWVKKGGEVQTSTVVHAIHPRE
jgi:hypothetical protein